MRDILVFGIVFGLIPFIFKHPKFGIYAWSWLGYMNPQRLTWGFAYSFPFSMIVALATLVSLLVWKSPKRFPLNAITIIWLFFILWITITTTFALFDYAWWEYERVIKIQLFVFLTIVVIQNRKDLDILIWVITLSIGYYSIKGGAFTVVTLGGFRVWGPANSYIEENNALAVASLMVLPLFYYLRLQMNKPAIRHFLLVGILLTAISIIGSQSRGALLAIIVTGFYLWLKSPGKIISGFAIVILAIGVISFMPQSWFDRMETIENYEQDESAMGRIAAWNLAVTIANSRPLGAGFSPWQPIVYRAYSDNPDDWVRNTAAHSIYFSVLAEHGWVGLLVFVSIFLLAWARAGRLANAVRGRSDLKWAGDLMRMTQVSLVAYGSGGAFLQLSYFDLPWHIVSLVIVVRQIVEREMLASRLVKD